MISCFEGTPVYLGQNLDMGEHQESTMMTHLREWVKFATSKQVVPTLKGATKFRIQLFFPYESIAMFSNLKGDTKPSLGALAYTLAIALVFIRKYDDLSSYPLTLASMIIITITGGPGKPLGACIQSVVLAMGGVLLGCGFFAILALLAAAPVAQGVVLALIVYCKLSSMCASQLLTLYLATVMSIVKAYGQRWFIFSLLSIILAFNGVGAVVFYCHILTVPLPDLHFNTSE
jgi:hypothetical protein